MMASWMASRIVFSDMAGSLCSRYQGQCVDRAADLLAEHGVDAAMLLDPAHARELAGDDRRAEVVPSAGQVDDVGARAGQGRLDALFELFRAGHAQDRLASPEGRYTS